MLYYIIVYIYTIYIYIPRLWDGQSIFLPGRSCQAEPGGFQISDGPGAAFCVFFFCGAGSEKRGTEICR